MESTASSIPTFVRMTVRSEIRAFATISREEVAKGYEKKETTKSTKSTKKSFSFPLWLSCSWWFKAFMLFATALPCRKSLSHWSPQTWISVTERARGGLPSSLCRASVPVATLAVDCSASETVRAQYLPTVLLLWSVLFCWFFSALIEVPFSPAGFGMAIT